MKKVSKITENEKGELGKVCKACNVWKTLECFHKKADYAGGVVSTCSLCLREKRLQGKPPTLTSLGKVRKDHKGWKWEAGKNVFIGSVFGRLTVTSIHPANATESKKQLECICECGKFIIAPLSSIASGHTRSCGCFQKETIGGLRRTHGESLINNGGVSREYDSWQHMRQRCNNENNEEYHNYGGRGIKVCDEWEDYKTFLLDMGRRPEGMSIDRIDVNLGYFKNNCRWATDEVQANNKRNNLKCEYNGHTGSLMSILKVLGIDNKYDTIYTRLKKGYSLKEAIENSLYSRRKGND